MQAFFLSLANIISTIWNWIVDLFTSFFSLLDYLGNSIEFVLSSINRLPEFVRVPCSIILGVMIIKFILSFGKQ